MPKPWDACEHKNHYDYYAGGTCMEFCSWHEYHCRDCGRFVQSCQCGCCNGESGWSHERWRKFNRRKAG